MLTENLLGFCKARDSDQYLIIRDLVMKICYRAEDLTSLKRSEVVSAYLPTSCSFPSQFLM